MASRRRGGPPDLKSTLGAFFRSTLEQASAVKDVVEQQTRSRGGLIDQALTQRKRNSLFCKLGEEIFSLGSRGQLGALALEPEVAMLLEQLQDLNDEADWDAPDSAGFEVRRRDRTSEAVSSAGYQRPSPSAAAGQEEYRVWRPVASEEKTLFDDDNDRPVEAAKGHEEEATSSSGISNARVPSRGGHNDSSHNDSKSHGHGIHFPGQGTTDDSESDDDLAAYMHEDDVPDS